ncbi:Mediator of RNA polymerase II transcription subunit 25 [Apostasia shenzhenica]|uniref:Mediator of RNA polymerase II transcription subunit 25 n=1 Tax=Apostasia shenzhenica TaxID=1088818 RepID=A0A2I0AJ29_9ASPA|nr:Mediator of RNA polymerase II transcription subunit 25 [Apostasia shenzhenica]
MAEKQLIVIVEGTAALGPYWQTVVSDYLEKIIRCFCGNELSGQKLAGANPELALIVFNTHGPYSAFLVQRSGWTKDVDVFLLWLLRVPFSGGGFGDVAIAEGLSEALMMFAIPTNASQSLQNLDGQRHCILVAASNPYPLPTPVYSPSISNKEHGDNAETPTDTCLNDAESVAKSFGQCFVSLSVICPRQLPKLRAIYNAGKRNSRTADPAVDNVKNPHFTILLSESFVEARAALTRPMMGNLVTNQGMVKLDTIPAVPGPATTSIPSVTGPMINRPQNPVASIPPATVKVEPITVSTMVSGPGYPHIAPISSVTSQGVPSLQASSPSPTSHEMNATNESMQEHKPLVNPVPQTLRPVGPAPANVNILNTLSQHRQVVNSASITGASSIGLQTMGGNPMAMHVSNMISTGMASSAMPGIASVAGSGALMSTAQVAQNAALGSFASSNSHISGNSNMGIAPALTNLQISAGMGQSLPVVGQGNLSASAQTGQGGISMAPNIMNGLGPTSMASSSGTMIPTPGISQQQGVNSLGLTNNAAINMPLTQPGAQQTQPKYVKIWEGALSGQRQGQPVFICKLEGYKSATASESLAADWPPSMQIVRLIAQDHMNNKQYVGKADFLVFRTLNQHGFLAQLQEKKLCAVIQLPSQTLLLSVSDKAGRLIGMLFPGDMVVFKPQVSGQQQQQQQLQQQLQQQQLQQQTQQNQHLQQQQASQQQQQLAMVGAGMNQTFVQGSGRPQIHPQAKISSSTMSNGGFLP